MLIAILGMTLTQSNSAFARDCIRDLVIDSVSSDCSNALQGASGLRVELDVHVEILNPGCGASSHPCTLNIDISRTGPTFHIGTLEVTNEYTITWDVTNPISLDPDGGPATLGFWVDVSPTATRDLVTLDGKICVEEGANPDCGLVSPDGGCRDGATITDCWAVVKLIKDNISAGIFPPVDPGPAPMVDTPHRFGAAIAIGEINDSRTCSPGTTNATDLVVGAPASTVDFGSGSSTERGAVYVLFGETSPVGCPSVAYDSDCSEIVTGPGLIGNDGSLGTDVDVGELETGTAGSGGLDLLLGDPGADFPSFNDAGMALLMEGPSLSSAGILSELPNWETDAGFGTSVVVGNFGGTQPGLDIAVGVPGASGGDGEVHVYLSKSSGPFFFERCVISTPGQAGGKFGFSLAALDDQGQKDALVVGAPNDDPDGQAPFTTEGRAYIYKRTMGQTKFCDGAELALEPMSISTGDNFGWAVAAGDVGGPGNSSEIAVGNPSRDFGGGLFEWVVTVYDIGGNDLNEIQAPCPQGSPNFNMGLMGMELAIADIDNDTNADVIVGIPFADPCGVLDAGEVFAFTKPLDLTNPPLGWRYFIDSGILMTPEAEAWCGAGLAAGDIDSSCPGSEVAVGLPGADNGTNTDEGRIVILQ